MCPYVKLFKKIFSHLFEAVFQDVVLFKQNWLIISIIVDLHSIVPINNSSPVYIRALQIEAKGVDISLID